MSKPKESGWPRTFRPRKRPPTTSVTSRRTSRATSMPTSRGTSMPTRTRSPRPGRSTSRSRSMHRPAWGLSKGHGTGRAPRSSWSSDCSSPPPPPCSTGAREVPRAEATHSPSRSPPPARARPSPKRRSRRRSPKLLPPRDSRRDRSDRRAHARGDCDGGSRGAPDGRSLGAADGSTRPTDGNTGAAFPRGNTSAAFSRGDTSAAFPRGGPGPSAVAAGLDGESGSGREERELRPERALHGAARAGLRGSLAHRSVRSRPAPRDDVGRQDVLPRADVFPRALGTLHGPRVCGTRPVRRAVVLFDLPEPPHGRAGPLRPAILRFLLP